MDEQREGILKELNKFVRPGHKPPQAWETYNIKQLLQELHTLRSMCRPVYEPNEPLFNPYLHPELVEQKRRYEGNLQH